MRAYLRRMVLTRRSALAGIAGLLPWGYGRAQAPVEMPSRVPVLEVRSQAGRRSVIVPGSSIPLLGVRQPGPELYAGLASCVTETFKEPGYRSPLLRPHAASADGARAPWAQDWSPELLRELQRRVLCATPRELPEAGAAEFVEALLRRAHPHRALDLAAYACQGRGLVTRTQHVLAGAASRGLAIGGLELAAAADERIAKIPDRMASEAARRMLSTSANERARKLLLALNQGDWAAATSEFLDRAPDETARSAMRRHLIDENVTAILPRLANDLHKGELLAVIDVALLGGERGVIKMLQDKGFEVRTALAPAQAL